MVLEWHSGTEKTAVLSSSYFGFTYQFLRVVLRKKAAADRPEKAAADRPPCHQEVHLDTVEIDPDLDQDTHLADIPN